MPPETQAPPAPAPAAAVAAPAAGRLSAVTIAIIFVLLVAEGFVVFYVTSYVKTPENVEAKPTQNVEFVSLGDVSATLPLEGTPTARYFRMSVSLYLGTKEQEDTKQRIEQLKPKILDEIQSIMMQESYPTVRHPESKRRIKEKIKDLLLQMLGPDRIGEVALPTYEPQ